MPSYRIYRVGGGGRLMAGESFHALTDEDAVVRAAAFRKGDELAELWTGGRLVGRFVKLGGFEHASG